MRIGHLISNYFPSVGGAQVCIHHVANRIIDSGNEATVITPARGGRDDRFFKYEILRLNPLINKLLFFNFSLGKRHLEYILSCIQKRYNFDVWQVTFGYPLGAASVDFFNKNKIPSVLRCTGEDLQTLPEVGYGYRLQEKVDKIIGENYKKFIAVITSGESTKRDYLLLGVPEGRVFIIPNGVECPKFDIEIDRKNVRDKLGVGEGQKLLLTVGRNHAKKGYKDIPFIIEKLLRRNVDLKWLLVGKGAEDIKRLAEKKGLGKYIITKETKVSFSETGEPEVPNNELIQYYKAADVFVFPTMIELFAKSLIEAMAAGLPIVTTNTPGVNDIIKDSENGLKSKVGDIEGLAECILKLTSSEELAKRISKNALISAKQYDWSRVAGMYLNLYRQLLLR